MADVFDKATRSRIMRSIKSTNTKPEIRLAEELDRLKIAHERQKKLPGRPDFTIGALCVFVHGCFWHRCPRHYKHPKSRVEHWRQHIGKNVARHLRNCKRLNRLGYKTLVVWEHESAG